MLNKRLLFVYHRSNPEAVLRDNTAVENALTPVQKTFAEHGFRTFGEQTMKQVYSSLEQETLVGSSVDSLIALALNHNADVLVVMEMIAVKPYKTSGTLFKVGSKVHFRLYEAVTGKQIAETIVVQNEVSIKKPDDHKWNVLFGKAANQAVMESIRQSTELYNPFLSKHKFGRSGIFYSFQRLFSTESNNDCGTPGKYNCFQKSF